MKKFVPPLQKSCALALAVCLSSTVAVHAQRPSSAGRSSPPVVAAAARPVPTPAITVAPASDEENEPSPPLDLPPGTPQTTETEILATDGATFASKERIAVFKGNVKVTDPRFQLSCDTLTVFLNKSANTDATGAGATPAPVSTPSPLAKGAAPEPAPTPGSSGGIDHAIAEGHVVIVQERAATQGGEAKRSVGRGDWANFDNKTGDMVLKGTPSVEQNENTHVATSPNTIMTLRKDNSLTTIGPSKTTIIQRKGTQLPGSDSPASGAQPGQTVARPGQPTPAPAAGRRTHGPAAAPSPAAAAAVRG